MTIHPKSIALKLFLFCILLCGCTTSQSDARNKLTILVAASSRSAVEKIAEEYGQANPAVEIRISSGSSNGLAQQILAGAPADVFLSADSKWVDALEDKIPIKSRMKLLSNRLVLVVPADNPANVRSPKDLLSSSVTLVALAGRNVPAGAYAEQALKALGVFERLDETSKIVRGSDVRMTLAYVERGEVDAGIVYATDAKISKAVNVVWEFDSDLHAPIIYPVVLLKQKRGSNHAQDFFEFLAAGTAAKIFEEYGFEVVN